MSKKRQKDPSTTPTEKLPERQTSTEGTDAPAEKPQVEDKPIAEGAKMTQPKYRNWDITPLPSVGDAIDFLKVSVGDSVTSLREFIRGYGNLKDPPQGAVEVWASAIAVARRLLLKVDDTFPAP